MLPENHCHCAGIFSVSVALSQSPHTVPMFTLFSRCTLHMDEACTWEFSSCIHLHIHFSSLRYQLRDTATKQKRKKKNRVESWYKHILSWLDASRVLPACTWYLLSSLAVSCPRGAIWPERVFHRSSRKKKTEMRPSVPTLLPVVSSAWHRAILQVHHLHE